MVAARPDVVQGALVELYRAHGCSWTPFVVQEKGQPDGAVGLGGVTDLVEFKSGDKGEVAPHQAAWHRDWRGSPVWVPREREDVIQHVESMRRRSRVLKGVG